MHGFHRSRVRIFFEVLCAFTISASCVGAWIQTYAWALLPAAFVSGLYGLVHAFDVAGRRSTGAADPQMIDSATDQQYDFLADQDAYVPQAAGEQVTIEKPVQEAASDPELTAENAVQDSAVDEELTTEIATEEAAPVEPAAPRTSESRRARAPRKGGARRAPKAAKVTDLPRHVEAERTVPVKDMEAELAAPVTDEEEEAGIPIVPLFEPEPFARQQRAVFGRKAG
jgi:hypothetical protein